MTPGGGSMRGGSSVASNSAWPRPGEAPAIEDLAKCVHCGLCVNACPTYVITGLETESPRGRIALARAIEEGDMLLTPAVQGHWELCLQCRACEAVCPSGVPYGRIMEHARAQLDEDAPTGKPARRVRKQLLRNIVARPRVLAAVVLPARLFAGSWLRRNVASRITPRLGRLGEMEAQLPAHPGRPVRPGDRLAVASPETATGVLFTGCIMGELFGGVHRATANVYARAGVTLEASEGQVCCGALHAHDGDIDFARELARKNIAGLEHTEGKIVVNSAGCGAAMKEYHDLLHEDPDWRDRAAAFSSRVVDATEYLATLDPAFPSKIEGRVSYQDPCHLAHAQRIREQPRSLLRAAGCDIVEAAGGDMCCGAAGLYSVVQPDMSRKLRAKKAQIFRDVQPDLVVTANPGCQMQYESAMREAGLRAPVKHIMEVLDEASSGRANEGRVRRVWRRLRG